MSEHCPTCGGAGGFQYSTGIDEGWKDCPQCNKDPEFIRQFESLAAIGAAWQKDSSLEKWFPFTAEELKSAKSNYGQLYVLVEAYLCTPNTSPAVAEAYDKLVEWFQSNKRPDGSEPIPVAHNSSGQFFECGDCEPCLSGNPKQCIYRTPLN